MAAATQQMSLRDYIPYVSKTSLIPSRLVLNEGIYFTYKILTSALASSGKAFFFRLFEKEKIEKLARW